MEFNKIAAQKRAALRSTLQEQFGAEVGDSVLERFVTVRPPEVNFGAREYRQITMGPGGARGGSTIKPGNITLQLHGLLEAVSTGVLAGASAVQSPWLLPFALLATLFALTRGATISLTERDTTVLWAIHIAEPETGAVLERELVTAVNDELARHGRQPLSAEYVADAVARLMRLNCIEYAQSVAGRLRLCETVRIEYGLQ